MVGLFFFFKQKTAYEMRISDWSSDVCSSDLPETGYGYIEAGNEIDGHPGVNAVATFTEKPDLATARAYVDGGRHFWNSGIFLFAARTYNDELATHAPEIANCCAAAMAGVHADGLFLRPHHASSLASPNISVDYAVMERTNRAVVVSVAMGWSDVGSWDAL